MKNKGDKIARLVLAGLGAAAVQVAGIPGMPPWVNAICTIAAVLAGSASPSLVGIQRTRYAKSATPGGAPQAIDTDEPKK